MLGGRESGSAEDLRDLSKPRKADEGKWGRAEERK